MIICQSRWGYPDIRLEDLGEHFIWSYHRYKDEEVHAEILDDFETGAYPGSYSWVRLDVSGTKGIYAMAYLQVLRIG